MLMRKPACSYHRIIAAYWGGRKRTARGARSSCEKSQNAIRASIADGIAKLTNRLQLFLGAWRVDFAEIKGHEVECNTPIAFYWRSRLYHLVAQP